MREGEREETVSNWEGKNYFLGISGRNKREVYSWKPSDREKDPDKEESLICRL